MRRLLITFAGGLIAMVGVLFVGFRFVAHNMAGRLQAKAAEAQTRRPAQPTRGRGM